MKRIPSLDGFRAISIILVIIAHCRLSAGFPHQFEDIARHGAVGVKVFFVISGFLITTLLLKDEATNGNINIKAFYLKRALRILPIFFLYILFVTIWRNFEDISLKKNDIVHALTFTVNFAEHWGAWFTLHFWTLSVEEQFYITWPAILIIFRKRLNIALFILIGYTVISRIIDYKYPQHLVVLLTPYFSYAAPIMTGAFGALILFKHPGIIKQGIFRNYLLQLAAAGIIVFFVYCSGYGKMGKIALPFGDIGISAGILFLIFAYIHPSESLVFRFLNSRLMVHIGILSYSLYVWQQFFIVGQLKVIWRLFPYNVIFIYAAALISYYLWERPFLNLKDKLITKPVHRINA